MKIIHSYDILPLGFSIMRGPTYGITWNGGQGHHRWMIGWHREHGWRCVRERVGYGRH